MDRLLQDLRYALRSFAKTPGFTIVVLMTLGIGIGVNATVFGFVNALLLRPAPGLRDAGRVVSVFTSDFSSGLYGSSSYPDYESIKTATTAFEALAAFTEGGVTLVRLGRGATDRVRTTAVSGEYFATIGVSALAGDVIRPAHAGASPAPVAVIGHDLWQRAFGGAASAIGAEILLDGVPRTVIGILPRRFDGLNIGNRIELWVPLQAQTDPAQRGRRGLSMVGRLAQGISLREAQAQLDALAARLAADFPESNRGTLRHPNDPRPMAVVHHSRLHPRFRGEVAMVGATLMGAVTLVLLIACANVAGLLLSRSSARGREVAVRRALGATRARLLRQMLTESVLLGAGGGAFGLLFALWTADVLPSYFPAEQAQLLDARVDWDVVMFTGAVALASGLIFGLAPAFHGLRAAAAGSLRADTGRSGDSSRTTGVRHALVIAQVALASILLISATLLTRSLVNGLDADPGFSTREGVVVSVELPSTFTRARGLAYYDALVNAVNAVPGVERASVARTVPVAGGSRRIFSIPGYVPRQGEDMELHVNTVQRDYFATMGMPVIQGRLFEPTDRPEGAAVVVNEVFANRYFGGAATGRRITYGRDGELEIIGVVRAQRRIGLQEVATAVVFFQLGFDYMPRAMLVAKTATDAFALSDAIRKTATAVDDSVAVFRTVTLADHLADGVVANRLTATLVATCGVMAFVLAVVGVYGTVAYAVVRRTREVGVRVALGATPGQVMALFARDGGRVIVLGAAAGVLGALASTRLLQSLLYGVSATDLATFVAVPLAVGAIGMIATCIPAARALRISPIAALRED